MTQNITKRHRWILSCIGEGYCHKEIANEMGISLKTAESHISDIRRILRLGSMCSLVRLALALGLCSPLCLLLMTGCSVPASKPTAPPVPPASAPPMPKAIARPPLIAAPEVALPPRSRDVTIEYPPFLYTYTWYLESSPSMKAWTTMSVSDVYSYSNVPQHRWISVTNTHLVMFSGKAPSGAYTVQMPANAAIYFWRLRGVK